MTYLLEYFHDVMSHKLWYTRWTPFQQLINIHSACYLPPAHPSWRCTTPSMAHCYCLEFGARANTGHHVWGMSKVGVWKVSWCSTETSPNHCTGLWWAEHITFQRSFYSYKSVWTRSTSMNSMNPSVIPRLISILCKSLGMNLTMIPSSISAYTHDTDFNSGFYGWVIHILYYYWFA